MGGPSAKHNSSCPCPLLRRPWFSDICFHSFLCGSYLFVFLHNTADVCHIVRQCGLNVRWWHTGHQQQVLLSVTLIDCRLSSTLPHVSQPTHAGSITSHRRWSTCIGCESQSGFCTSCVCWHIVVCMAPHRSTWPIWFKRRNDWIATPPSACTDHPADRTFHATINDRWPFLSSCCTTRLEQSPWNTAETFVMSPVRRSSKNLLFRTLILANWQIPIV